MINFPSDFYFVFSILFLVTLTIQVTTAHKGVHLSVFIQILSQNELDKEAYSIP